MTEPEGKKEELQENSEPLAEESAGVEESAGAEEASGEAESAAPDEGQADEGPTDEGQADEGSEESLFFDLPEDQPEEAGPEEEPEPAAVGDAEAGDGPAADDGPATDDDLLAALEIELSEDEKAEIERRGLMNWFVVHANTGHENKVKRNIEMAVKSNHMENFFGEVLVATQEVTEMKNGKRSTVKRKFFPSYILIEMIMNKETQHFINSIPGVTRFVGGTPLVPQPITKEEADRILGRISGPGDVKETIEIPYEVGDSVQVTDGPFTEWMGVINEINHDKGKLKVMISIFGSETPVELDFLQVKPI